MGYGVMMCDWFSGIFLWVFIVIVITGLVYLVLQSMKSKGKGVFTEDDPLEILKRRYAKGEISQDEFKKMKEDLKS